MTIQGITCNVCKKPMPEQTAQQATVPLPPITLINGHLQRINAQFLAGGFEVEILEVPCEDINHNPLPPRKMEKVFTDPKFFDICAACQIKFVRQGLIIAAANSGDPDLMAWAE